jgi:hypothetical protein
MQWVGVIGIMLGTGNPAPFMMKLFQEAIVAAVTAYAGELLRDALVGVVKSLANISNALKNYRPKFRRIIQQRVESSSSEWSDLIPKPEEAQGSDYADEQPEDDDSTNSVSIVQREEGVVTIESIHKRAERISRVANSLFLTLTQVNDEKFLGLIGPHLWHERYRSITKAIQESPFFNRDGKVDLEEIQIAHKLMFTLLRAINNNNTPVDQQVSTFINEEIQKSENKRKLPSQINTMFRNSKNTSENYLDLIVLLKAIEQINVSEIRSSSDILHQIRIYITNTSSLIAGQNLDENSRYRILKYLRQPLERTSHPENISFIPFLLRDGLQHVYMFDAIERARSRYKDIAYCAAAIWRYHSHTYTVQKDDDPSGYMRRFWTMHTLWESSGLNAYRFLIYGMKHLFVPRYPTTPKIDSSHKTNILREIFQVDILRNELRQAYLAHRIYIGTVSRRQLLIGPKIEIDTYATDFFTGYMCSRFLAVICMQMAGTCTEEITTEVAQRYLNYLNTMLPREYLVKTTGNLDGIKEYDHYYKGRVQLMNKNWTAVELQKVLVELRRQLD